MAENPDRYDPMTRTPPRLDAVRAKLDAAEQDLEQLQAAARGLRERPQAAAARRGGREEVRDRTAGPRPARGARQPRPRAGRGEDGRRHRAARDRRLRDGRAVPRRAPAARRHADRVRPGHRVRPEPHQAVMQQPTNDFEPGQVVQVLQQGFLLHDRVLRPATRDRGRPTSGRWKQRVKAYGPIDCSTT